MINNILIYLGIGIVSWIICLIIIYIGMETFQFVMEKWSGYGK